MKIVHVCQYYNDGYGYQENLLPKYQQDLGHDVIIITSDRNSYFCKSKKPKVKGLGIFYDNGLKILRMKILFEIKGRFVFFKSLLNVLKKEKPDYIFHHGLSSPSIISCARYKKINKEIFLAADNHADLINSARNIVSRLFYYNFLWKKIILRKFIRYYDIVFGVNPARCEFARKIYGVPREIVQLLPIGADEKNSRKIINQTKRSFERKTESDSLKLVTGGKWFFGKGLEQLLEAVYFTPNVELTIFGSIDGKLYKKIESYITDNITILGWQDRESTLKLLAQADIAVWPKQHTTLIEDAISVCTPLLLRHNGSTSHFIRGNGLYLFSDTVEEIRQCINLLVTSKDLLVHMKKHTMERLKYFSYYRIAEESVRIVNFFKNTNN